MHVRYLCGAERSWLVCCDEVCVICMRGLYQPRFPRAAIPLMDTYVITTITYTLVSFCPCISTQDTEDTEDT